MCVEHEVPSIPPRRTPSQHTTIPTHTHTHTHHNHPAQTLFGGYEGVCSDGATLLFVIMGNFTSKPVAHGHEGREQLLGALVWRACLARPTRQSFVCLFV